MTPQNCSGFILSRLKPTNLPANLPHRKTATKPAKKVSIEEILEIEKAERERERQLTQATIDDLRKRLDEESQERKKLTQLLLTHQPEPTKQKKENLLFKKIFKNECL